MTKRGPTVPPDVEALIAAISKEHPKWKAPRIRNEVEFRLREKDRSTPRGWPSLSKVQKVLAVVRRKMRQTDPEDQAWTMAELRDGLVTPGSLPAVLAVWKLQLEIGEALSIRHAKWASRLSGLLSREEALAYLNTPAGVTERARDDDSLEGVIERVELLSFWSERYANAEYLAHIIDRPLSTRDIDLALLHLPGTWADYCDEEARLTRREKLLKYLADKETKTGRRTK